MRYSRQEKLVNMEIIENSTVLLAGVGGLGSFSSTILAISGIGNIILVDYDKVEESNLNRQILYREQDIGLEKAKVAAQRLREINPRISVKGIVERIDDDFTIPENVDIVVDGLDNYETRFILEEKAIEKGIPYVFGAVEGFMGMVSFIDTTTVRLKDIVRKIPKGNPQVLASTVGFTASLQASEVIKFLTKKGDLLRNRLLIYDALSTNFLEVMV
jgi:molybdopterin/thiamine biosynthesis adenylyltransferase